MKKKSRPKGHQTGLKAQRNMDFDRDWLKHNECKVYAPETYFLNLSIQLIFLYRAPTLKPYTAQTKQEKAESH